MAKIQADYEKLSEVSAQAVTQADNVTAAFQTAVQCVGNLQGGGWASTAADSFYAEWSEVVTPGTQRLMDALQLLARTASQVASVLRDAENNASAKFKPAN